MTTIELSNPACRVVISPERGGRVVSFVSTGSGVEHVGPEHLQIWLKTGTIRDPAAGVLHLFYGDFRTREFEMDQTDSPRSVRLRAESEGVSFQKRVRLDGAKPVVTLELEAVNNSDRPRVVQVECFFHWSFGPTTTRRNVHTLIQRGGASTLYPLPPYGTMDCSSFDIDGGTLALCDTDQDETLRIVPDANWQRFAIYQMSGCWRGPYSPEKSLAPGETFRATLQLVLSPGCEAVGQPAVAAVYDRRSHRDSQRRSQTAATARFGYPTFPIRVIDLNASRTGTPVDSLKWLLEHVIAPAGYTHVQLECSVRLRSHPELAGEASYLPGEIRELTKFARSLGMEIIAIQNFYGHQSAITRAHPDLQEVPGDPGVYCPTNPKTRRLVAEIIREMVEIFEPRQFHIGHDEIQLAGNPQRVGVCPRCRQRRPWEVFAYDVNEIHAVLKAAGVRTWMWSDMLIRPEYLSKWQGNGNGVAGEVYRALDLIPRDIVIADWHYFAVEDYRSSQGFLDRGFEVCPAVWYSKEGIREYAKYAHSIGLKSMMMTTWANADLSSLPVESVLYAGRVFQDVAAGNDPDLDEQVRLAAHDLWGEWTKRVKP